MSATELKKLLVKRIQSTDDIEILNALRVLTERKVQPVAKALRNFHARPVREKTQKKLIPLKPMTQDEFYARNAQSQKDIREGKVFSQQEIKKRFGYQK